MMTQAPAAAAPAAARKAMVRRPVATPSSDSDSMSEPSTAPGVSSDSAGAQPTEAADRISEAASDERTAEAKNAIIDDLGARRALRCAGLAASRPILRFTTARQTRLAPDAPPPANHRATQAPTPNPNTR